MIRGRQYENKIAGGKKTHACMGMYLRAWNYCDAPISVKFVTGLKSRKLHSMK